MFSRAGPAFGRLEPDECRVWFADIGLGERFAHVLDAGERVRAAEFRHPDDRLRYVSAHVVARLAIGAHLNVDPAAVRFETVCKRCGGPHGKPVVRGAADRIAFSLAHSGRRVAVAATCGVPVGVDVEYHDSRTARDDATMNLVLTARELDAVRACAPADRPRAFLRSWTLKEAALKATGDGLAVSPAALEVSAPGAEPRLLGWTARPAPEAPIRLYELDAGDDYSAALAVMRAEQLRVVVRKADGAP